MPEARFGNPSPAPERPDEKQPQQAPAPFELKLEEVARSPEKVTGYYDRRRGSEAEGKIATLAPWGDYTLVGIKDLALLRIFDERGKLLTDLQNKEGLSVSFEWYNLIGRKFPTKSHLVSRGSPPQYEAVSVSDLPLFLQGPAEQALGGYNSLRVTNMSGGGKALTGYKLLQFEGGKYLLCIDPKSKAFVGYITENERDIRVAPRDWKRLTFTDEREQFPDEFAAHIEKTIKQTDDVKELSGKYSALMTDVGLNIVENANPDAAPVYEQVIPSVATNITVDPANPDTIYYCSSLSPQAITRLDLGGDPKSWQPRAAELPRQYASVRNLQLDPTGTYFLFYTEEDLVMLAKETLEEIKRVPGMKEANFDTQGRIRAVDKAGFLVTYAPDTRGLAEAMEGKRLERIAKGVSVGELFKVERIKAQPTAAIEQAKNLEPIKAKMEAETSAAIAALENLEHAANFRKSMAELERQLRLQGLSNAEVAFIVLGIDTKVKERERQFVAKETEPVFAAVERGLSTGLSLVSAPELKRDLDRLKAAELLMSESARTRFSTLSSEFTVKYKELFLREGGKVIAEVKGLVGGVRGELDRMTSKNEFDDWVEFRLPQYKGKLGALLRECPLEADEAYQAISTARTELQDLAETFRVKFEQEYVEIRSKAVGKMEAVVANLESDIGALVKRLQDKNFRDRREAEMYLQGSEAKKVLEGEIRALEKDQPDLATELSRALKVQIANGLSAIERGAKVNIGTTGEQLVLFGTTPFPRFEAKVKERAARKVDLTFLADPKSHGARVQAHDIQGDVTFVVRHEDGTKEQVPPFAGWKDEHEWQLGLLTSKGSEIPPSYVTAHEFKEIKREYAAWEGGVLRGEFEKLRAELTTLYTKREKVGKRGETDARWQKEYRTKLKEYAEFASAHHVALFRRADALKTRPEEATNGKGFVPSWQSHWVVDPETERNLERMARDFKMQLDLKEGVLNLNGHAGTGKDVLVKMFCNRTNRPYFSTDCTKWTTEYELSEDVILEAKDGATQTVCVPSAVLSGIQTPGAVVYFNEVNGMPEQAQIFLHALWDEKRALTLKTSSGKVIKAHPSVLFASSMNPGYPGTFAPQFATKDRMVPLEIGYPPLYREKAAGDTNPNRPYSASEALRIAREVASLSDLTFEPNMERNEFVLIWDSYVNGIANGAPKPTAEQEFDIKVILALVQFGNKLREDFIKNFEKTRDARSALPVRQPLTARGLRRCAYALSTIPVAEKVTGNADQVARSLLERFFLSHIYESEDRDKIKTAMNTWRSQKRVAA